MYIFVKKMIGLIDMRHEEYGLETVVLPTNYYVQKTLSFKDDLFRHQYALAVKYALPASEFQNNINGHTLLSHFIKSIQENTMSDTIISVQLHPLIMNAIVEIVSKYDNLVKAIKCPTPVINKIIPINPINTIYLSSAFIPPKVFNPYISFVNPCPGFVDPYSNPLFFPDAAYYKEKHIKNECLKILHKQFQNYK